MSRTREIHVLLLSEVESATGVKPANDRVAIGTLIVRDRRRKIFINMFVYQRERTARFELAMLSRQFGKLVPYH